MNDNVINMESVPVQNIGVIPSRNDSRIDPKARKPELVDALIVNMAHNGWDSLHPASLAKISNFPKATQKALLREAREHREQQRLAIEQMVEPVTVTYVNEEGKKAKRLVTKDELLDAYDKHFPLDADILYYPLAGNFRMGIVPHAYVVRSYERDSNGKPLPPANYSTIGIPAQVQDSVHDDKTSLWKNIEGNVSDLVGKQQMTNAEKLRACRKLLDANFLQSDCRRLLGPTAQKLVHLLNLSTMMANARTPGPDGKTKVLDPILPPVNSKGEQPATLYDLLISGDPIGETILKAARPTGDMQKVLSKPTRDNISGLLSSLAGRTERRDKMLTRAEMQQQVTSASSVLIRTFFDMVLNPHNHKGEIQSLNELATRDAEFNAACEGFFNKWGVPLNVPDATATEAEEPSEELEEVEAS